MKTRLFFAALIVASAAGCTRGVKDYEPYGADRTLFMPTFRANAPDPVYRRARWVQLPEVLPSREMPGEDPREGPNVGPAIRPVFQFAINDATLEETARVLAALARYSSFTAPSIAKLPFSTENLGTIDELAQIIGRKAQIEVIVDHQNREVRFLAPSSEAPQLFTE
jgi:hypothetical protein